MLKLFDSASAAGARTRRWLLPAVLTALLCGQLGEARAQVKAAALARINLLNKQSMDDYDGLEFESAKKKLLEALSVAEGASLTKGRELAATYINLGIVYGAGFDNRIKAIEAFTKGLQAERSARIEPARATPALDEMFKTATDNVASQPPPRSTVSVRHVPVTRARAGRRLVIRVAVSDGVDVGDVVVYYRLGPDAPYHRARARRRGTTVYAARIPARRVRPPTLQYYVEALDDDGARLAGAGSQQEPMEVDVRRPRRRRRAAKTLSISVMVGSGGGIVFGGSSEHIHPRAAGPFGAVDIKPGAAVAPMHIAAEVGYHLTRLWRLSALARIQVLTALSGLSVPQGNPVSFLGLARAKRYFGLGTVQPYLSFGAGGGQLRHRIALGDYDPNEDPTGSQTPNDIVDARVSGYGVLAFGGGLDLMLTEHFGLAIDATAMVLIPKFAAHLDLNLGFVVSF